MTTCLIIYIICYIISYRINKWIILSAFPLKGWNWSDVVFNLFMSTILFLGNILGILFTLDKRNKNSKPPKWL